ncbi:MAG: EamA family transporter [Anaerolineae bacterium]
MSHDRRPAPTWQIAATLAAVYLIWGSTYLGIRYAIETLPPFLMAGARFATAGAILYLWLRVRGAERPTWHNWRAAAIAGGLMLMCGNGGVVWAQSRVPSGLTALLTSGVPLYVALLEWVRRGGRRPAGRVGAGILLGVAGMVLLVGPHGLGGSRVDPLGALVLATGSFLWACGSLYARGAPLPRTPLLGTGMQMLCGGALLALVGTLHGEWSRFDAAAVSARSLVALAYLTFFGSLLGFSSYVWLLRNVPVALASTYAYVNPVIAILLGWALAGEPLSARTLAAGAIIIGAVFLVTTGSRPQPRAADVPSATSQPATDGGTADARL